MSEHALTIRLNDKGLPEDFRDLVKRCHQENPDKDDLQELRKQLNDNPELFRHVVDLSDSIQDMLVSKLAETNKTLQIGVKANMKALQNGMSYHESPVLEQLLIDNVINCWLRYQWVEYWLASSMGQSASYDQVNHWERRLSATQRRYLRACETLARVRKLTRNTPMLQVNIATEGGQQVNVAGDLVKND